MVLPYQDQLVGGALPLAECRRQGKPGKNTAKGCRQTHVESTRTVCSG